MRTIAALVFLGFHAVKWFVITTVVLWIVIFALGASLAEASETTPPVKMSNSEICHAIDSSYYKRTKNYTAYDTLDECLEAGGRLPKNYTPKKDA
jgi:hypothetical protein